MRQGVGRIVLILLVVGALAFAGITIYGNFFAGKDGEVKTPGAKEAAYSLTVKDTGTVILANKVEVMGETVGARTYILNGYWELHGREFSFKSGQLVMSEKIFGEITLKKRVAAA